MSKRQAYVIIALLAVIALALAVGLGYLLGASGDDDEVPASDDAGRASSSPGTEPVVADPVAALETAGIDVVEPPPVPDPPDAWGDYALGESWDGRVRAFSGSESVRATAADGSVFPASQNSCGALMYLVTFRATGEGRIVDAQLLDAAGGVRDSEELNSGWMLGTNCSTPAFAFDGAGDASMVDVAYTVHEYRQASVAQDPPVQQSSSQVPVPAPSVPAEPTFVECVAGLASLGIYSDGSTRPDDRCPPRHALEAERVCGGLYGWQEVGRERYIELCGVEPPTG